MQCPHCFYDMLPGETECPICAQRRRQAWSYLRKRADWVPEQRWLAHLVEAIPVVILVALTAFHWFATIPVAAALMYVLMIMHDLGAPGVVTSMGIGVCWVRFALTLILLAIYAPEGDVVRAALWGALYGVVAAYFVYRIWSRRGPAFP